MSVLPYSMPIAAMLPYFSRRLVAVLIVPLLAGCRSEPRPIAAGADSVPPASSPRAGTAQRSPDLARRADSLAALDPEQEARGAIARGDLRFVGVCGFACLPVGVPLDSARRSRDSLAIRGDSLRLIAGTSDAVVNEDVARLNEVARRYAERYNRIVWAHRATLR